MKRFFDTELEMLRSNIVLMGEIAVRQVRQAIEALTAGDLGLADQVAAADDELDQLEIKIDEEAIRYMSLRSPVATELRLVIVGMKAGHDLERVGDESTNIVRRISRLSQEPPLEPAADIPRMANIAVEMLRDALDCFLKVDAQKALQVCQRDKDVDALNKSMYQVLTTMMREKPHTVNRALELIFISKSIERIADHASNIAEEMIYLAEGEDVRHTKATRNPDAQ